MKFALLSSVCALAFSFSVHAEETTVLPTATEATVEAGQTSSKAVAKAKKKGKKKKGKKKKRQDGM